MNEIKKLFPNKYWKSDNEANALLNIKHVQNGIDKLCAYEISENLLHIQICDVLYMDSMLCCRLCTRYFRMKCTFSLSHWITFHIVEIFADASLHVSFCFCPCVIVQHLCAAVLLPKLSVFYHHISTLFICVVFRTFSW